MTDDFRCSMASVADDEPMIGTAPTDTTYLLVEAPGPWGREAITDNRLPEPVREHLAGRPEKVFLIRRPNGASDEHTRVFLVHSGDEGFEVSAMVLDDPLDLLSLDLADFDPHPGLLWLVCTNGKRDLCCAEIGREVTASLIEPWPEETWETTHLGGHRFSGTLLAFPSGWCLGRLGAHDAIEACAAVADGGVSLEHARGRVGRSGVEQVREIHVLSGGSPDVEIVATPGPVRRQSCGDLKQKGTTLFEVRASS